MTSRPSPTLRPDGALQRSRVRCATTRLAAVALVSMVVAAGCTTSLQGRSDRTRDHVEAGGTTTTSTHATTRTGGGTAGQPPDLHPTKAECRPGRGKTVRQLPDVDIPAVRWSATHNPATVIGGKRVGAFDVGEVSIPEQVIDGGCVIVHDAPGGCLGAVDITGVRIPSVRVPGYTVPAVHLADGDADAVTEDGGTAAGSTIPAQHQAQVCRQKPSGGYIASVYRPTLYRPSGYRTTIYRASAYRSSIYRNGGTNLPSASVPGQTLASVSVDSVSVPSAQIDSTTLPTDKDTQVLRDEQQTAYATSTDVLFDFGRAELKPAAMSALNAIVADLARHYPSGPIRVEGHTDAVGSDAANQKLSEQRAEAVKQYLVDHGHLAANRITAVGYGESVPVAPDTNADGSDDPTGRAANRRVVISARRS